MFQYKVAPKIETDRLLIRVVREEDCKDFYEFCSDPLVCKYLTFNPYKTISHTRFIINNMINAYIHGTDVNFSIILKDNMKVIGSISLNFKEKNNVAEVGYLLNSSYWNKGYMDEALKAIINVTFEYYNVDFIVATYIKENISSEKLLEKNNFIIDGIIEKGINKNNINYDVIKCYRYR